MKIRQLRLYLFPLEDLHCGFGLQQGNILPSLPFVPGRVLRGGLAGWAIRRGRVKSNGDTLFEKLFLPKPSSEDYKISYPFCTYRGNFPSPLSLFDKKGSSEEPVSIMLGERRRAISKNGSLSAGGAIDFLRRVDWPSMVDNTLKPLSGQVDRSGFFTPASPLKVDLRNRHEDTGKVGQNGLFGEEALLAANALRPEEHYYSGSLVFEEKEEILKVFSPLLDATFLRPNQAIRRDIFDVLDPLRMLFLGHRRVPVVVFATDLGSIDTDNGDLPTSLERSINENEFTWTAMSDIVPLSAPPYPLSADMLNKALPPLNCTKKRVFCSRGWAYGFDTASGKDLLPVSTIGAGSCGRFEGCLDEKTVRVLWGKSMIGMGKNTRDGFGRFEINWDLRDIT